MTNERPQTIGIIGTAGRQSDSKRLDARTWEAMIEDARQRVTELWICYGHPIDAVSGGAAFADHLAVRMFLERRVRNLTLHLPASISPEGYEETNGGRFDAGRTANKLHRRFQQIAGVDAAAEICAAIATGAQYTESGGFKERNRLIARDADHLVAYTFGGDNIRSVTKSDTGFSEAKSAGLKEGGTSDTWDKAVDALTKLHVPVHQLQNPVHDLTPAP